jgi:hypothetical protein
LEQRLLIGLQKYQLYFLKKIVLAEFWKEFSLLRS